jgi:hypothetical protein
VDSIADTTELIFQLRYFSDNRFHNKVSKMVGMFSISGTNIISVDTNIARVFAGSGVAHFGFLHASQFVRADSTVPSFYTQFIARNLSGGVTGDSLFVNVIVSVKDTGTICIDTIPTPSPDPEVPPLSFRTELGYNYQPLWSGPCCPQVYFSIPTLTEWGLIVFALVLMTSVFIYLRKVRRLRSVFDASL